MRSLVAAAILLCAGGGAAAAAHGPCVLTSADKIANRRLTFQQFDQDGVTRSTWRALDLAGCHALAAEAADDYLANGPAQTEGHKSDILFHEAQSLAYNGDRIVAARLVAAAIPPGRGRHGELDWTAYLTGTWAFLAKDRATLDAAARKMAAELGDSNALDGGILKGLLQCFDKPYAEAYVACRPLRRK